MPKITTTRTIVPALAGWYVVELIEAGESADERWDDGLALDPIIAWEIGQHSDEDGNDWHSVTPITHDCSARVEPIAVKRPDGKFEIPWNGYMLDSEAKTIAMLKDLRDRNRKKLRPV
jgi:hypothetical protein